MTTGIAASQLAKMTQDELLMNLGALHKEDKQKALFMLSINKDFSVSSLEDDLDTGRSFFGRLNKQAHDFFCGDCGESDDTDCLGRLKKALGVSEDQATIIAALSSLLVSTFGWAAAIGGLVAAILVKFLFPAALDNICVEWKSD